MNSWERWFGFGFITCGIRFGLSELIDGINGLSNRFGARNISLGISCVFTLSMYIKSVSRVELIECVHPQGGKGIQRRRKKGQLRSRSDRVYQGRSWGALLYYCTMPAYLSHLSISTCSNRLRSQA